MENSASRLMRSIKCYASVDVSQKDCTDPISLANIARCLDADHFMEGRIEFAYGCIRGTLSWDEGSVERGCSKRCGRAALSCFWGYLEIMPISER